MTQEEKKETREDSEERYPSYIYIRHSGKQHNNLKTDLQNDFTTGNTSFPMTFQDTLHSL